jgi:hypothetical protein
MTTYLTYEGQPPRTESNPEVIANLVRKGWVVSEPPVVEEVVATFTAEEIVAQYFSPYQIAALSRLEMALLQAGKPLGPQMTAAKTWLETVMLGWAVSPVAAPAEAFGVPSVTFEQASAEAVSSLNPEA